MKKFWLVPLLLFTGGVSAATPQDACVALTEARGHLVAMIGSTDRSTQDSIKAQVHAASAKLDEALAGMQAADAGRVAQFQPVWEAFKNTRESEIIPAVYAGRNADAKAIATGIQAKRMTQMKAAMGCK